MAEDIKPVVQGAVVWNADKAREQVNSLYDKLVEKTNKSIDWYVDKRRRPSMVARSCRAAAIFLTVLGGLCPIMKAAFNQPSFTIGSLKFTILFSEAGYLFLGFAFAATMVDKYGGFSTAWMRYIKTHLRLDSMLQQFQFDWQIACAAVDLGEKPNDPDKLVGLIKKLQQFAIDVGAQVEAETQAWAVEFQQSLAMLASVAGQKEAEKEAEKPKSGAVDVTLENFDDVKASDAIFIFVDGAPMIKVKEKSTSVKPVPLGAHNISAHATLNNKLLKDAKSATVEAASPAQVSLKLVE